MKWPDFSKHVETVTMERGTDGVYRAVSDRFTTQETEVREHRSGCWILDFLNDFGLAPEDHLFAPELEHAPKISFGKNEYDPDQGFWDGYDNP